MCIRCIYIVVEGELAVLQRYHAARGRATAALSLGSKQQKVMCVCVCVHRYMCIRCIYIFVEGELAVLQRYCRGKVPYCGKVTYCISCATFPLSA